MKKRISDSVIRRLPRYFRYLTELTRCGETRISSAMLSEKMNVTASQVRQDFNCFGGFGQQGYGYSVPALKQEIASILGADMGNRAIIVGMGHLGTALMKNMNFAKYGVSVAGVFDISPQVVGTTVNGMQVRSMDEIEAFCSQEKPNLAILTLSRDSTQTVAAQLQQYGIRGFLNFASVELSLDGAYVENVHFGDGLMMLCYALKQEQQGGDGSDAKNSGTK